MTNSTIYKGQMTMDEMVSELIDADVGTMLCIATVIDMMCDDEIISRPRLIARLRAKSAEIQCRATDGQAWPMAQLEACLSLEANH
jgi:hypothetical protein